MPRGVTWGVIVLLGMGPATAAWAAGAKAVLVATAPDGAMRGEVTLTDTEAGLTISARLVNAPPGVHGFHIHEFGSCAEAAQAAGGHFNPDGAAHGDLAAQGLAAAHAGDFGNVEVESGGLGTLERVYPGLRVADGRYGVAGRALVVHAAPDDLTSQPSGNAGPRIACGPILIADER